MDIKGKSCDLFKKISIGFCVSIRYVTTFYLLVWLVLGACTNPGGAPQDLLLIRKNLINRPTSDFIRQFFEFCRSKLVGFRFLVLEYHQDFLAHLYLAAKLQASSVSVPDSWLWPLCTSPISDERSTVVSTNVHMIARSGFRLECKFGSRQNSILKDDPASE